MILVKKIIGFLITIVLLLVPNKQCFANKIIGFDLEPFITLGLNDIIQENYGIKVYSNILDYISIGYSVAQNVINNEYYKKNITDNIIAYNKQEITLPDKFYHYCYDIDLKIKTPEIYKSRLIVTYGKHNNIINKDNYELLYISQNMSFFNYETYGVAYEINLKRFSLDLYFNKNHIYDNIKNNFEYGIDYTYKFNSNSSFTIGYSYSYDKLKNDFDDGITNKYLIKDEEYLYFKYKKRISQINKNLLIKNGINSIKLASNFKINDNMRVVFSLITSVDNNRNKSLFFKFGLGF